MKLNKKLKYVLGSIGLATFAIIPASVGLVSCSKKEEKDVIEHYKQVDNAIFDGKYMGKDSSPFICDLNLTQKTCAIVDWFGNEPNYMTPDLPPRTGLSEGLNKKINNTIRIPSQVVYNNEIFTVVAFGTISSWPLNNTYEGNLDLGDIMSNTIQIIEFDPNLIIKSNDNYYRGGNIIYYPGDIKQPDLLKVLNYTNDIYISTLKNSKKLETITGDWVPGDIQGCSSLKSIPPLYDGLVQIWDKAFQNCSSLTSINIPESVRAIREQAFQNCSSLTSINIPYDVILIGDSAFYNCWRLTNVNISYGITRIYDFAFANCSSLKSITIPESVTYFGEDIFYGSHPNGFKIYFHSEEQMKLFQSTNSNMEQYCEVI